MSRQKSWQRCSAITSRSLERLTRRSETPDQKSESHLTTRRSVRFEILRDPIWNNIRVDELTLRLVDTEIFQRLRYVRQLGLAYLVYPGSTHTRFEHALGTYHLARGTLSLMAERDGLGGADADEQTI